jgi:hypothetical protein
MKKVHIVCFVNCFIRLGDQQQMGLVRENQKSINGGFT